MRIGTGSILTKTNIVIPTTEGGYFMMVNFMLFYTWSDRGTDSTSTGTCILGCRKNKMDWDT
jgi:hypothetical protein